MNTDLKEFITNLALQEKVLNAISSVLYRETAIGSDTATLQTMFSKPNRFNTNIVTLNHEQRGPIFITRPKLNLTSSSLRQDQMLTCLDTYDINTTAFLIRCLLDSNFSVFSNLSPGRQFADKCKLLNNRSPFILPLSNAITSISGWPDFTMETETTEGGFKSEDLTFAKGWDRLNKTYNLSITVKDYPGGLLMALFMVWFVYIAMATLGEVLMYGEDVDRMRLCYTTSIYAFTLDRTGRFLQKWAKATGCFPIGLPIGNCFNFNEGESYISSASKFSITFVANKIEYMTPAILADFNAVSQRFYTKNNTDIFKNDNSSPLGKLPTLPIESKYNFMGIPFIDTHSYAVPELAYKFDPDIDKYPATEIDPQILSLLSLYKDNGYLIDASLDSKYTNLIDQESNILTNIYDTVTT